MAEQRIGIIMHGVTGRMGYNQHLVRSILAIREQGGLALGNGDRLIPDPILVGRDAAKLEAMAERHGLTRWTTDVSVALADPRDTIFFDAGTTQMRASLVGQALDAVAKGAVPVWLAPLAAWDHFVPRATACQCPVHCQGKRV